MRGKLTIHIRDTFDSARFMRSAREDICCLLRDLYYDYGRLEPLNARLLNKGDYIYLLGLYRIETGDDEDGSIRYGTSFEIFSENISAIYGCVCCAKIESIMHSVWMINIMDSI